METLALILLVIFSYLLGSIPFGVLFARMKGVNLLECGSRSTGATNAFRCAGPVVGLLTALFDILKGWVPVWAADLFLSESGYGIYLVGLAAIFGHTKSLFLRFRGGKAIATSFGVFLYLNTVPVLLTAVVWLIFLLLTRIVSLASVLSGVALPLITFFYRDEPALFWITLIVGLYAIWRHKENIRRILQGTEKRISFRSTSK